MNCLDEIVQMQKRGEVRGIPSVCSAHPWVLRAAMENATNTGAPLLVEATCNQVNQFGGYTGMRPGDFVRYIHSIAEENHFPVERVILGGDHLGPSVWQNEPAEVAMQKAEEMVRAYVRAGFTKIHLDASMNLAGDPTGVLPVEVCAIRAARLAKVAEQTWVGANLPAPRYVIGTEVPVPGGAREHENGVEITTVERVQDTLTVTREIFRREQVEAAWERVIAVVVQPGVEFGDDFVLAYQPEKAQDLARFIESEPKLVYEAHSTDYQTREALKHLVRDHFAILKVGPALTFAFREAVFALAMIENELYPQATRSNLIEVLDMAMVRHPEYWRNYYHGTAEEQAFKRKFSLSDRARYYWMVPEVQGALERLLVNLGKGPLPRVLISQFVPDFTGKIERGEVENIPEAIILAKIGDILENYSTACGRWGA
jgi:D-tagatose-1,6-bisphosphate aldolase subunit GatZ/KbaZ